MNTAGRLLSTTRTAVGAGSWLAPGSSWALFGLGPGSEVDGSTGTATRLFAARELALGVGLHHPDREVRRALLRAGVAIDLVDLVASLIGVRRGSPRRSLVGVTAGAVFFAALGAAALREE